MYKRKSYITITSWSPKTQQAFGLFLQSPYCNAQPHVLECYHWLLPQLESGIQPDHRQLFKVLFGSEPFNDTKIRLLLSQLFKLTEKFILFEQYNHQPSYTEEIRLLQYYRSQKHWKAYHSKHNLLSKQLEKSDIPASIQARHKLQLLLETSAQESATESVNQTTLAAIAHWLPITHFGEMLKEACAIISNQRVFNVQYDLSFLPAILSWLEKNEDKLDIATRVYYNYYLMMQETESDQHFHRFFNLIREHDQSFPNNETRELYLAANNYCIRKLNQGIKAYGRTALEVYKEALAKNLLFVDGKISSHTYSNMVALGLKNQEIQWVEHFLENYTIYLDSQLQESTYLLNKARLQYALGANDEALAALRQVDLNSIINNLSAKTLMIKIFYEAAEWDVLYYQLKAMKAFLYRNKIIGYHKKAFVNLIQLTQKLMRAQHKDSSSLHKLRDTIMETDVVWEKQWLLAQLDGLDK